MLCVVPVETVASGVECLVILCIEELIGQVEGVLLVGAWHLYLGLDSVQLGICCYHVGSGEFLTHNACLEPSARLVSVLCGSDVVDVVGKLTDGSIFLNSLCCQHATVNTDILQGIVGLEDDVQHVAHLCVTGCHWDGYSA